MFNFSILYLFQPWVVEKICQNLGSTIQIASKFSLKLRHECEIVIQLIIGAKQRFSATLIVDLFERAIRLPNARSLPKSAVCQTLLSAKPVRPGASP